MTITDIVDVASVEAIVRHPAFVPHSMQREYRAIARKTGLDLDATIRLMAFLPPFLAGAEHEAVRKAMAARVSATKAAQIDAVRQGSAALIRGLFRPRSQFDLVADLARPLWQQLSAAMIGPDGEAVDLADDIPALFSGTTSLIRRGAINDAIQTFIDTDPVTADERLMILCLSVLGARPFVGALALSLYEIIDAADGASAARIAWPRIFPRTALTFIDRVAIEDVTVGATAFGKGERVRARTAHAGLTAQEQERLLFGVGGHACLGRSISQFAWTSVTSEIGMLDVSIAARGMAMDPSSEPFDMPSQAIVAVI